TEPSLACVVSLAAGGTTELALALAAAAVVSLAAGGTLTTTSPLPGTTTARPSGLPPRPLPWCLPPCFGPWGFPPAPLPWCLPPVFGRCGLPAGWGRCGLPPVFGLA